MNGDGEFDFRTTDYDENFIYHGYYISDGRGGYAVKSFASNHGTYLLRLSGDETVYCMSAHFDPAPIPGCNHFFEIWKPGVHSYKISKNGVFADASGDFLNFRHKITKDDLAAAMIFDIALKYNQPRPFSYGFYDNVLGFLGMAAAKGHALAAEILRTQGGPQAIVGALGDSACETRVTRPLHRKRRIGGG